MSQRRSRKKCCLLSASTGSWLVPLIPLAILFLTGPPIRLLHVPESWIVAPKDVSAKNTRLIGAAMLVGVLAAALARPSKAKSTPKAFFDGAGYAFANVVSLIVTANCFGKAIEQIGLAHGIGRLVQAAPGLLLPLAGSIPLLFAAISGSGMASTQSLYGLFVGPGCPIHTEGSSTPPETIEEGKRVGAIVAIAAAAGRTMSPVAAVALMCCFDGECQSFYVGEAGRIAAVGELGDCGGTANDRGTLNKNHCWAALFGKLSNP